MKSHSIVLTFTQKQNNIRVDVTTACGIKFKDAMEIHDFESSNPGISINGVVGLNSVENVGRCLAIFIYKK
jgi:hypothetical protein